MSPHSQTQLFQSLDYMQSWLYQQKDVKTLKHCIFCYLGVVKIWNLGLNGKGGTIKCWEQGEWEWFDMQEKGIHCFEEKHFENSVKHYRGFPKMKILLEKKCKVKILMIFSYFFLSLRAKKNVFWILSKYPGGKYKFWQQDHLSLFPFPRCRQHSIMKSRI